MIKQAGGATRDEDWHEHDGVVPTCSMAGPWGSGNRVVTVEDIVRDGGSGLQQGTWVNLGKEGSMDHLGCTGQCIKIGRVEELYMRISKLLEVLPLDKRIGKLDED